MGIERKINYQLNKCPAIKRIVKRVYQKGMYAVSNKIKCEGNIERISPNDNYEYFFGYYDKSPWDATDRYMLCMKADNTWKDVSPKSASDILLIDTQKEETDTQRVVKIAQTHTWNVQQGCMAQWLGPDYSSQIIYNDYRDGKYVSVILTLESKEEKIIPMPIYAVSADGKFALTLDFSRLYNLRPGYGYYNMPEETKGVPLPDTTCIWKIDLKTGNVEKLLKYTDFATFQPREEMLEKNSVHKVNHIMISPNGERFMVLYRWFNGQRKNTRLITCNTDGTGMYLLSDDDMVSHCYWKDDKTIIAFENKKKGGQGYYLMKDKTQKYIHCWPQFSNDGHPSYSPDGKKIVTDSYPNRARIASINIMDGDERKKDSKTIARVFAPFKYDNDTRCDLHPRWNRKGNKICFDSVFEGHRGLYVVDLDNEKINIVFVVTACKKSGPIEQMLSIITYMDRTKFSPILITLYEEPDDGTSQLQKYIAQGVRHYRVPLNKIDIMTGRTSQLKNKLRELNPSIVHSLGVFPDYALSTMKFPGHVVTIRNFVYDDYLVKYGKVRGMIMSKMHLYAMKHTDKTWTCSESLANKYRDELGLNFSFIRNGVNLSHFKNVGLEEKQEIKRKLNLPSDKTIIAYAGQFVDRKNQRFLLEIFSEYRELDDYILILMGEGADLEILKNKYCNLPNIIFTGNVENVNEYLQASDIYISSSKSEGLPNGVLEAMATGLPIILSDIEQHKEVYDTDRKIGFLYKSGDKKDCVKKICEMTPDVRENAGRAAYKCAHEQFDAAKMSLAYQQEYIKVMNKVANSGKLGI
jgi:glycosyltransferase involved in cell wall biosynthesis